MFIDGPCRCQHKLRFDVVAKLGAWCHSYKRDVLFPTHDPMTIEWWFRYWCPRCGGLTETTFDTHSGAPVPRWLPDTNVLQFDDQWRLQWVG